MVKMMNGYDGKPFKSITDNDIHAATEDEKKAMEEKQEENKELLDAIKAALGDSVKEVRLSARLADAPAGLTSEGPLSLEMEKGSQRKASRRRNKSGAYSRARSTIILFSTPLNVRCRQAGKTLRFTRSLFTTRLCLQRDSR